MDRTMTDNTEHAPQGPGSPYISFFDEQEPIGTDLPESWRPIYGSWYMPDKGDVPYTFVNFVTSRDGRISFNEPGKSSGGPISRHYRHDLWMMGLLRARADAIIIGSSAIHTAPRHIWTPATIFPDDRTSWEALRAAEGREPVPLHVVVTRSGEIDAQSVVIRDPQIRVLIATTTDSATKARSAVGTAPNVDVIGFDKHIDYQRLQQILMASYGVRTLLSEAGPQVYGALMADDAVHDEFLTLSPILVGSSEDKPRPGLIEGVTFMPDAPPQSKLLGVRRSGDYLFLHSRYV